MLVNSRKANFNALEKFAFFTHFFAIFRYASANVRQLTFGSFALRDDYNSFGVC